MKLSSLFIQGNQSHMESSSTEASSALEQNLKNGMEEIAAKAPGQSVTGEVIEKNGNDILLSIGKNQLLRAKLDAAVPVEEGQMMTFTIKNIGSAKVVLNPLYANTGNDPNISRALQMAGIPENAVSAKMVQTMMQEGMSIDRDSLNQMMRIVNLNPDADIETLIQLSRLDIPVTENSIFQLEAYKNYEHQITEGLLEIADTLADTLSELVAAGDAQGGIELYREVISLLSEQMGNEEEIDSLVNVNEESGGDANIQEDMLSLTDALEQSEIPKETAAGGEAAAEKLAAGDGLTEREIHVLSQELTRAGMSEDLVKAFASGELSGVELFQHLSELLLQKDMLPGQRESITKLLGSKEFNQILKNEMTKQWMITPEEVAEENKVENLYERLNSQLNRLNQALCQAAKEDTSFGKAVSNLSGNIDFMNQLNQMFTYIQLPLKLQGQEANGELYVYTNKKNLAKKDGEVSALLHLDMEHLGSVDVHVVMKDNHVSTKFYLKDDSALDLIADHIDILNERLNNRGYSMNTSFIKKGEGESDNVMEEILKQDKNIPLLSGYSFDARA